MYSKLLKVFQTTSVKEFNDIFAQFACQEELSQLMKTAKTVVPTPKFEVLFKMAEAKYQEMLERDEWSGISSSAFLVLELASTAYLKIICLISALNLRIKTESRLTRRYSLILRSKETTRRTVRAKANPKLVNLHLLQKRRRMEESLMVNQCTS